MIVTIALAIAGILLLLPMLLLIVPFWAVSRLTGWITRFIEPSIKAWNEIVEFHPRLGWKPVPNIYAYSLADDVYQLSTDADGWRGKHSLDESDVIVVGDSFGFGDGVDDKDLYSDLSDQIKIKPLGACGYTMVQELLLVREYADRLRGKLVVWFVYLGNDLYESITPDMQGYRVPFVRRAPEGRGWCIETSHVNSESWTSSSKRRRYLQILAELCRTGHLSDRVYSAAAFLIKEGRDTCQNAGAELAVMSIPDQTQLSRSGMKKLASKTKGEIDPRFPDRQFEKICARLGIKFLAGMDHLKLSDYKQENVHWNERGHRAVNILLERLFHDFRNESAEVALATRRLKPRRALHCSESA